MRHVRFTPVVVAVRHNAYSLGLRKRGIRQILKSCNTLARWISPPRSWDAPPEEPDAARLASESKARAGDSWPRVGRTFRSCRREVPIGDTRLPLLAAPSLLPPALPDDAGRATTGSSSMPHPLPSIASISVSAPPLPRPNAQNSSFRIQNAELRNVNGRCMHCIGSSHRFTRFRQSHAIQSRVGRMQVPSLAVGLARGCLTCADLPT